MPATTHTGHVGTRYAASQAARTIIRPGTPERAIPLLIFIFCFAYLYVIRHYSTLEPDEGIVLRGAERILAGQIPYRDFFTFYTPGAFYLVAGLFRAFGDSFAVARISLATSGAICSVVTYALARRVCSREIALFAAVLATTAGTAFRFLVLHNLYSTLSCCLCLYAALRFAETGKRVWAFATGTLASFTFLIEQSKGGGLFIGLALGFALLRISSEFRPQRHAAGIAAFGSSWPFALAFAYFGIHHTTGLMLQAWIWPLHHYTQANQVPYGYQNWSDRARDIIFHTGPLWLRVIKTFAVAPGLLIPVLPLVALGLLLYKGIRLRRKVEDSLQTPYYVLLCSVSTGLLISVVIARPDILHFIYLAPIWYVVLAWILGAQDARSETLLTFRVPLIAFVAASFGLLSMAILFAATGAHVRVEARRGLIATPGEDTVIEYVQNHLPANGELLVYPYLPLYNYLTATRSPSRLDYFQPGMNTVDQAEEIVLSLKSRKSPVLFEPAFSEKIANSWPQTPLSAIVNDPVANYIARNYRVCRQLRSPDGWRFEFMVKRGMPCS